VKFLAALSLVLFPSAFALAQSLIYAPLPMQNARSSMAYNQPLVSFLEASIGQPVKVRHMSDYDEILRGLVSGEVDLAYLGPLPLLVLESMSPDVVPVVTFREKDGLPHYTCAIAVPYDGATALEDLADISEPLTVALTQSLSTCGYLSTFWQLHRAGVDVSRVEFSYLGSHEAVALALVRGEYMVGGIKTVIAEEYRPLGLKILATSPTLPGFTLVANARRMSESTIAALREALVTAPDAALTDMHLGRHGFSLPDDSGHKRVEQMLHETNISLDDLRGGLH